MTSPLMVLGDGSWIGGYEIVDRLRTGGMATLFLARQHGVAGFSRLAALKVIHPHLSHEERFVDMFVDEARICSQIAHPNVIHVEAFGEDNGLHYLVMEYLDGCSAGDVLRWIRQEDAKLDPELAARIVMQAAGGLHAAHEARGVDGQPLNVVHRDISPSNIVLSTEGHVKVIDFGIAKSRGRRVETEAEHSLKGKLRYMAPEQAASSDVDRRADIFSLGVVFWELLVGEPLFPSKSEIALLERLTAPNVRPPSEVEPLVPAELDEIVLTMLSQDPDDRQATAWDVRRQIVQTLPGAATRAPQEVGQLVRTVRAAVGINRKTLGSSSGTDFSAAGASRTPFSHPPSGRTPPMSSDGIDDSYDIEISTSASARRSRLRTAVKLGAVGVLMVASLVIGLALAGDDGEGAERATPPSPSTTVEKSTAPAEPPPPGPAATTVEDDSRPAPLPTEADVGEHSGEEPEPERAAASSTERKIDAEPRRRRKRRPARADVEPVEPEVRKKESERIRKGSVTIVDGFDDEGQDGSSKTDKVEPGGTPIVTDFDR